MKRLRKKICELQRDLMTPALLKRRSTQAVQVINVSFFSFLRVPGNRNHQPKWYDQVQAPQHRFVRTKFATFGKR